MHDHHAAHRILARYGLSEAARIGGGMEAQVYALDAQRVLKIYHHLPTKSHLTALQSAYRRFDATHVPFHLPSIYSISQEGTLLYTVEKRILGDSFASVLPSIVPTRLSAALDRYLATIQALSQIAIDGPITQYKLLDPEQRSLVTFGDWNHFLQRYVTQHARQLALWFEPDVVDFSHKIHLLHNRLARPYTGALRLIHGDFCPGNMLVDAQMHVTGVVDFGLFTMIGDPLFDIATGSAFFDMYDERTHGTRHLLYERAIQQYGQATRASLYLYLLIYSVVAANTYAADCSDGHYTWCVRNLNTNEYWRTLAETDVA